jgi:hypothetical protein
LATAPSTLTVMVPDEGALLKLTVRNAGYVWVFGF